MCVCACKRVHASRTVRFFVEFRSFFPAVGIWCNFFAVFPKDISFKCNFIWVICTYQAKENLTFKFKFKQTKNASLMLDSCFVFSKQKRSFSFSIWLCKSLKQISVDLIINKHIIQGKFWFLWSLVITKVTFWQKIHFYIS